MVDWNGTTVISVQNPPEAAGAFLQYCPDKEMRRVIPDPRQTESNPLDFRCERLISP